MSTTPKDDIPEDDHREAIMRRVLWCLQNANQSLEAGRYMEALWGIAFAKDAFNRPRPFPDC